MRWFPRSELLLGDAGVQAALAGLAGLQRAVGHARQGAVEPGRGDATVAAQQHGTGLEATAGAEPAQLQRHVHEDLVLELGWGHVFSAVGSIIVRTRAEGELNGCAGPRSMSCFPSQHEVFNQSR